MKSISHALVALVLITIMFSFSSKTNATNVQLINEHDVISLQVKGSWLGAKGSIFEQNDVKGKTVITKLVGWINSAEVSKAEVEEKQFGKHGYPMVINIKMSDGEVVHIEPAYTCTIVTNKDGSGLKTCSDIKGEILRTKDSETIRLKSPEVYDWLQGGWKQE